MPAEPLALVVIKQPASCGLSYTKDMGASIPALEASPISRLENLEERQTVFVTVVYKEVGLLRSRFLHLWNRKWMVIAMLLWLEAVVGLKQESYRKVLERMKVVQRFV